MVIHSGADDDKITDDKVTLETNSVGEGGSRHFKPVILDSTVCIYEEPFPKLQSKTDCCQCHEVTHLGSGCFHLNSSVDQLRQNPTKFL